MDRKDILRSMFDAKGLGLEVGPSFNPLVPKAQGYRVEIVDHATAAELRDKYASAGVDLAAIEEVDFISHGKSIYDAVRRDGHYDFIVASHVIEHTVDMLGFLQDCEKMLKPSGVLVLAIPDKSSVFDACRPFSTTGAVLDAHVQDRAAHSPGKVFDEVAYNVLKGGKLAWHGSDRGEIQFASTLGAAASIFDEVAKLGTFHDIHAWQFTPSSFQLIVRDLHEIGRTGLKEVKLIPADTEFYVALGRQGKGCQVPRLKLLKQAIREDRRLQV